MRMVRRPRWMDHPRIRGEHVCVPSHVRVPFGSSPHTRGARAERRRRPDPAGIIPAYAGSTRRRRSGSRTGGDHPRIRGEHPIAVHMKAYGTGSSPHTRGAHQRAPVWARHQGIIPAYAGSTRIRNIPNGITLGSSPHMRGALAALCRRRVTRADHPRIRGEHGASQDAQYGGEGSSPHTRGALNEIGVGDARGRIIPAYAGSTAAARAAPTTFRDHPRIRGEHQRRLPGDRPSSRIIPAYAGSTPRPSTSM